MGNERRAAWSNVPSSSSRRQPAIPIESSDSMSSSMRSRAPAVTRVSGLSASTYGAEPRRIATLLAAAKPRLLSPAISSTSGNSRSTISTVPSVEPLSTTHVLTGQLEDAREARSNSGEATRVRCTRRSPRRQQASSFDGRVYCGHVAIMRTG